MVSKLSLKGVVEVVVPEGATSLMIDTGVGYTNISEVVLLP